MKRIVTLAALSAAILLSVTACAEISVMASRDYVNLKTNLHPVTNRLGEVVGYVLGTQTNAVLYGYLGSMSGLRDKNDYRVYRRRKDIWRWTSAEGDIPTPQDFLETANSSNRDPLYYDRGTGGWFGATQFWPNGNRKYLADLPPGGETNLVLNFAFIFYAPDGTNVIARFRAIATRESSTDETLVYWDNEYIRVVTTDVLDHGLSAATNGLRSVDGAARPLPRYLHALDFADSYPDEAAWYYQFADAYVGGGCSVRRVGNTLERNYDWYYDETAEFVLKIGAGAGRFASVGVAGGIAALTEDVVTSGKPSRFYKCLPGKTLDGINERGVSICINVVTTNGSRWEVDLEGRDINAIGAVRWALDHGTSAGMAASNLAARVYIPESMKRMGYSCHFAVADVGSTWLVEDGKAYECPSDTPQVMTNYRIAVADDPYGTGYERYGILTNAENSITNAWFREAYRRPFSRPTEFSAPGVGTHGETDKLLSWAEENIPQGAPESLKRNGKSWQTVHTSVYDITNRTLRVAVQETDDWYTFSVPSGGGANEDEVERVVRRIVDAADPGFSNAVLAVQVDTNGYAAIRELCALFSDLPVDPVTGGISVGALLAALASAVVWLRKRVAGLPGRNIEETGDGQLEVSLDKAAGERQISDLTVSEIIECLGGTTRKRRHGITIGLDGETEYETVAEAVLSIPDDAAGDVELYLWEDETVLSGSEPFGGFVMRHNDQNIVLVGALPERRNRLVAGSDTLLGGVTNPERCYCSFRNLTIDALQYVRVMIKSTAEYNSTITFENVTFLGRIYNIGTGNRLQLEFIDCTVDGRAAPYNKEAIVVEVTGAVYHVGDPERSSVVASGSTFVGGAKAIFNIQTSHGNEFRNCTFNGDGIVADESRGLLQFSTSSDGENKFDGCTFVNADHIGLDGNAYPGSAILLRGKTVDPGMGVTVVNCVFGDGITYALSANKGNFAGQRATGYGNTFAAGVRPRTSLYGDGIEYSWPDDWNIEKTAPVSAAAADDEETPAGQKELGSCLLSDVLLTPDAINAGNEYFKDAVTACFSDADTTAYPRTAEKEG